MKSASPKSMLPCCEIEKIVLDSASADRERAQSSVCTVLNFILRLIQLFKDIDIALSIDLKIEGHT